MAIRKKVTAPNGVVTEYHRIVLLSIDVNNQNTVLVHSYLSEDARLVEKDYAEGKYDDVEEGIVQFPYVDARYLNPAYDGEMTVARAYEWLKAQPEFDGAEDC